MRRLFLGLWELATTPFGLVITLTAIWHFLLWVLHIRMHLITSIIVFVIDVVVIFFLLRGWTYFFSQFVLPVQTPQERVEIYDRVSSGPTGPAMFIKNGEVVASQGEEKKRGSGVVLVDTASAAVLRSDTQIHETIGPGITFTSRGEYPAGTVDLRMQLMTVGPIPGDQPFSTSPEHLKSNPDVQKRRQETTGLTRDGFEVVPTLSIKFSVQKPEPDFRHPQGKVNSRYGFNPTAVTNAIVRKMVQVGENNKKGVDLPWNQLPAHLAINLWREYVRKFTLLDLFTSEKTSGLQTIEEMINLRMKERFVADLSDTGTKTGRKLLSLEMQHLTDRGIQVEEVKIHCVHFDLFLEENLLQAWETNWLSTARKEKKQLEEWEALIETSARNEAVQSFAEMASRPFLSKARLSGNPFITLQLLVERIKETIVVEHSASSDLEEELRKMDEFAKWLKENNATAAFGKKEERI